MDEKPIRLFGTVRNAHRTEEKPKLPKLLVQAKQSTAQLQRKPEASIREVGYWELGNKPGFYQSVSCVLQNTAFCAACIQIN